MKFVDILNFIKYIPNYVLYNTNFEYIQNTKLVNQIQEDYYKWEHIDADCKTPFIDHLKQKYNTIDSIKNECDTLNIDDPKLLFNTLVEKCEHEKKHKLDIIHNNMINNLSELWTNIKPLYIDNIVKSEYANMLCENYSYNHNIKLLKDFDIEIPTNNFITPFVLDISIQSILKYEVLYGYDPAYNFNYLTNNTIKGCNHNVYINNSLYSDNIRYTLKYKLIYDFMKSLHLCFQTRHHSKHTFRKIDDTKDYKFKLNNTEMILHNFNYNNYNMKFYDVSYPYINLNILFPNEEINNNTETNSL